MNGHVTPEMIVFSALALLHFGILVEAAVAGAPGHTVASSLMVVIACAGVIVWLVGEDASPERTEE